MTAPTLDIEVDTAEAERKLDRLASKMWRPKRKRWQKLAITVALSAGSIYGLGTGRLTGSEFVTLIQTIIASFVAGNAAEHWAGRNQQGGQDDGP